MPYRTYSLLRAVSASVQMYYGYRVSMLSGSRIPLVIICTVRYPLLSSCIHTDASVIQLALMQGSAGIAQGVQAFQIHQFSELGAKAFVSCSVRLRQYVLRLVSFLISYFTWLRVGMACGERCM